MAASGRIHGSIEDEPVFCPADAGGGAVGIAIPRLISCDLPRTRSFNMKTMLALALIVMVAGGAFAQSSEDNMMGMFFAEPFVSENTNHVNAFAPFFAHVVLLNPTVESVGGYEVGVQLDPTVFVLGVTGPNGWTNFGNNTNHLCGYQTPLPVADGGTMLASLNMLYTGTDIIYIGYGQADPPSIPGVPVIADGSNPDLLLPCALTSDGGFVATINGGGVVATENHSLTSVKALFN